VDIDDAHDVELQSSNRKLVTANVRTALEIATKADENRLRKQANNHTAALLDEIHAFERAQPMPTLDLKAEQV
jgi:replication-associated recombination protein RarA